ncbi:LSU ribosomal protein L24P [Hydrogenispora ethanolica]|jgi:large subunit ribosomal protein L24|uniref:Large ribosomal subunit protein uL24 n=1 Tax=Hydrogenispora ethanolica TaxID=1082276 RepID=A0A4R1RJX5_HYDET|nr:50S ribosomal protein L24 [Hydrogenispora ethanolica]TCL66471.1 LSU ribosomal protein L24P [Hydrogenispora ethanolica]
MAVLHYKKGDEVVVLSGKDKGRHGKIQKVLPKDNAVVIEGINLAKKHAKPTKANPQGGVIDKSLPMDISKVMVICSGCNKPTRIRRDRAVDGALVRICRHCGRTLD